MTDALGCMAYLACLVTSLTSAYVVLCSTSAALCQVRVGARVAAQHAFEGWYGSDGTEAQCGQRVPYIWGEC